ncbi:MAG: LysR family transcriptional regulator [Cellvibrionaceae bacterium]
MKPSFEDIQFFLAVVESQSFTGAADKLMRTKSAVSQGITRLEKDLGIKLLYRSTRSLSLTEAGREFYNHCGDIRDSYDNALSSIKSFGAKPTGLLTITAPHTLIEKMVIPAMTRLLDEHPNIDVRLLADDKSIDLIDAQIDLAIRVGTLDMQTAKVSKLGTLYESIYASPSYVQAKGGIPDDAKLLENWQHIAHDWQRQPVRYTLKDSTTLKVKPRVRCNTITDIVQLTLQGQGVARLPDFTVNEYHKQGQLIKLGQVSSTAVHTMHMFSSQPPAKVKRFVKILKDQLKAQKAWKRQS